MMIDLALAEHNGKIMLHRADCPLVRELAEKGYPVMTMFECQGAPPDELERHSCLRPYTGPKPDDEQA